MNRTRKTRPYRKVLHVGCGAQGDGKLPSNYRTPDWREIRFDINPGVAPDIVGDMQSMPMIADNSMDAVFSSHNIEHLHHHEVLPTLREFHRVLKAGGHVLLLCPDLQQIARLIAEDRLMEPVLSPPAGPIAPIDMVFGYRVSLAKGKAYMAHKTGFTPSSLKGLLEEAGFREIRIATHPEPRLEIVALAAKLA